MMKIGERYLWRDKMAPQGWAVVEITRINNFGKCLVSHNVWRVGVPVIFGPEDEAEHLTLLPNQSKSNV